MGFGVDIGDKKQQIVVQERRFTTSFLKNIQDEVVVFQINSNDSKAGGGSCFGDSGGPVFLNGYVLGDASYVNSFTCNGTGSCQRADTVHSEGVPRSVPAVTASARRGRRAAAPPRLRFPNGFLSGLACDEQRRLGNLHDRRGSLRASLGIDLRGLGARP